MGFLKQAETVYLLSGLVGGRGPKLGGGAPLNRFSGRGAETLDDRALNWLLGHARAGFPEQRATFGQFGEQPRGPAQELVVEGRGDALGGAL
jgi:hypothetical protein